MIKQIMASALMTISVNNAQTNVTNIPYQYTIGANPTTTNSVLDIDSDTTCYKREKQNTNTYLNTWIKEFNFINHTGPENEYVTYNVWFSRNNYANTVSKTRYFLYMEYEQGQASHNIVSNDIDLVLRSSIVNIPQQEYVPYYDVKIYFTYNNQTWQNIFATPINEMNPTTMYDNIMGDYTKETYLNTQYRPTTNPYDQVEDSRTYNQDMGIYSGKTLQIVTIITPYFESNIETYQSIYVETNPDYVYQYDVDIEISGIAQAENNVIEVVDMPNVMWTILTMPFTFISMAFNLTLWPGTPYAVDIGSLALALLGIAIFIWLMQLFIKAKGGGN